MENLRFNQKLRMTWDKLIGSIFSKSLYVQTFWPLQLPTTNPGRYSQWWAKRFLGESYGQLQAERKFPTSRCKRLWKTWDLIWKPDRLGTKWPVQSSQKVYSNKLFGSCSCPQQTPVATASDGPSASLGKVMDNCKQRGSFPQAAVSGYGKLEI